MNCPHCGQEHPDEMIDCPVTGKKLKRACKNSGCSYYGEYLFPLDLDTCPCCGRSLIINNNGHEFVDLGLSVKWATCNVGAEKPEEYGDYFAWGETYPKSEYTWANLKYCNKPTGGSFSKPLRFLAVNSPKLLRILADSNDTEVISFSKYKQDHDGTQDNRNVLELDDDAARAIWGGDWRMPTNAEFQELIDKCKWEWTTENGKSGYKVVSKVNGNSIFLPAAGYREFDLLHFIVQGGSNLPNTGGIIGDYWSGSLGADGPNGAWALNFDPDHRYTDDNSRYLGQSVRPVCP